MYDGIDPVEVKAFILANIIYRTSPITRAEAGVFGDLPDAYDERVGLRLFLAAKGVFGNFIHMTFVVMSIFFHTDNPAKKVETLKQNSPKEGLSPIS